MDLMEKEGTQKELIRDRKCEEKKIRVVDA